VTEDALAGPDEHSEDVSVVDESVEDDEGLVDIGESSLNYFGADFDVAGLVRRLDDEDIVVPRFDPDESAGSEIKGFQRQRVWTGPRMEKFIESLLLGWPVPSIFLVLEPDQRYLVLDGQQRLTALQAFTAGRFPNGRVFALKDVAEHLQGATYQTLSPASKRKLNNTFIQATVIEPVGDQGRESVYRLFGRLNSGGVILTPQEIRVALYRGPIIDFIRDMNTDPSWRRLFGPAHKRLKDHELILRSLALLDVLRAMDGDWGNEKKKLETYKPPMSDFLNSYLSRHRGLEGIDPTALKGAFAKLCEQIVRSLGLDGLRYAGSLNAAHVDAVIANLLAMHTAGSPPEDSTMKDAISALRNSDTYRGYVTESTSHRDSVFGRLRLAQSALSGQAIE
jgi:hypothetical protein